MSDIIPEGILYGNLGVGSGTTNYNDLDNKPQINSVTLQGNKTASELGLVGTSDIPVTSVNGETGAVVLDGTEIEFSDGVSLNEKIIAVEQEIPVIAYPVTSVNSKTGAVVLDGTDINYQAGVTINQKIDAVEQEIPVVSYPVTSVNGETGAVVLDGTDIEYSSGVSVNSQIDTLMNYIPVYGNTASGAIATFDTSLALPLQDCTIDINAVQESGTPTPSSPKAISGFTGANIRVTGVNLWDEEWESGSISSSTGENTTGTGIRAKNYIPVKEDVIYYPRLNAELQTNATNIQVRFYDANKNYIGSDNYWGKTVLWNSNTTERTLRVPVGARFMRFALQPVYGSTYSDSNRISINYPATDTAYHAYNGNTTAITWQDEAGTVYGGGLKIANGYTKLVDNSNDIDLGTLTWTKNTSFANTLFVANITGKKTNNSNCLCTHYANGGIATGATFLNNLANNNFASDTSNGIYIRDDSKASLSGDDFKTAMSGVTLKYEVATPVEYTLTGIPPIYTLNGTNNIFGDTNGDTSVVYACSLKDYIDSQ